METNQNFTPQPIPPNNNVFIQQQHTKKVLYTAGLILSIIFTVLIAIYGLSLIVNSLFILHQGFSATEQKEKILAFASLIGGVFLLGLTVWLIIATVLISRQRNELATEKEKQHLVFSICVLVFGNLFAGILILLANCIILDRSAFSSQN